MGAKVMDHTKGITRICVDGDVVVLGKFKTSVRAMSSAAWADMPGRSGEEQTNLGVIYHGIAHQHRRYKLY